VGKPKGDESYMFLVGNLTTICLIVVKNEVHVTGFRKVKVVVFPNKAWVLGFPCLSKPYDSGYVEKSGIVHTIFQLESIIQTLS